MSQAAQDPTTSSASPADGWEKLRSALTVAAAWIGIAVVVEAVVSFVLVPRMPSSILLFITYGRSYPPYARFGVHDLVVVSWVVIVVVALLIFVGVLLSRRGAHWPLVLGLAIAVMVPWFLSATFLSVLAQLGASAPATTMNGGTQALIFVSNLVFAIIGVTTVIVVSSRRSASRIVAR
jgi:hypothetical protein